MLGWIIAAVIIHYSFTADHIRKVGIHLGKELDDLKQSVTDLTAQVGDMKTDVEAVAVKITDGVAALDQKISDLLAQIAGGTGASAPDLIALNTALQAVSATLNSAKGELDTIATPA